MKCIVLTAEGKHFCAGFDLKDTGVEVMLFDESKDQARKSLEMEERLIQM